MLSVEKPLALGSSAAGATVPPGDGAESVCQLLDSIPLAHLAHHATTASTQPLGTESRLPDLNFSLFSAASFAPFSQSAGRRVLAK